MAFSLTSFFASFFGNDCASRTNDEQTNLPFYIASCEQYQLDELMDDLSETARTSGCELMLDWLGKFANLAYFDDLRFEENVLAKGFRIFRKCHKADAEMQNLLNQFEHLSIAHRQQLLPLRQRINAVRLRPTMATGAISAQLQLQ